MKVQNADVFSTREALPKLMAEKFPVLTYGPTPSFDPKKWSFRVFGLVEKEVALTWDEFMRLPKTKLVADFHCVTQWSRLNNEWEGVTFRDVMKLVVPKPEGRFVMIHCDGGYTTDLPLETLMEEDVLFAYRHDGQALPAEHGGPLRLIVPKLYAWKSAKWVRGLEFMAADRPGFWEARGYNMRGTPGLEERFWH